MVSRMMTTAGGMRAGDGPLSTKERAEPQNFG